MANKFYPWLETFNSNSCYTGTEFAVLNERTTGFQGGTSASAKTVNTALRQANLVVCALMNIIIPNTGTDTSSMTVSTVQNYINTYINNNIITVNDYADSSTGGIIKTGFSTSDIDRNYAVQTDSDHKAYVNVPWSNQKTLYRHTLNISFYEGVTVSELPAAGTSQSFSFGAEIVATTSAQITGRSELYTALNSTISKYVILPSKITFNNWSGSQNNVYPSTCSFAPSGISFKFVNSTVEYSTVSPLSMTITDTITNITL